MATLFKRIWIPILLLFSYTAQSQVPDVLWKNCYGGSDADECRSIIQSNDGGYILAGYTQSTNGQVTHAYGNGDGWVVKLDKNGNKEWDKSFGGTGTEEIKSVQKTQDGGYIFAGYSNSDTSATGGSGTHGDFDFWVFKTDSAGGLEWHKSYGGSKEDIVTSVKQTGDGGYIVCGNAKSTDGDITGAHGDEDGWIIKLDANGNLLWQKSLGGSMDDVLNGIVQTPDGGFLAAGHTLSDDGDISGNHGQGDYWVIKLDASGNIVWSKTFGGSNPDEANAIALTNDGGCVVAGLSQSDDGDRNVAPWPYYDHYWILKLNDTGKIVWQGDYGGPGSEHAQDIKQTLDGGYIIVGTSTSNSGDVPNNYGGFDYWVLKINDTGHVEWSKNFGGTHDDYGETVLQDDDGNFVVGGFAYSTDKDVTGNHGAAGSSDFWIIKLRNSSHTGIHNSITQNDIEKYYNPETKKINLRLKALDDGSYQIALFDMEGREMISQKVWVHKNNQQTSFDMSPFSDGVYYLRLMEAKKRYTGKFLKY